MKFLAIACIGFVAVSTSIVLADVPAGVNILSQSYSASVSWNYGWDHVLNPQGVQSLQPYSNGSGTTNATSNNGTPISVGFTVVNPPGLSTGLGGGANLDTFSFYIGSSAGNDQYGYGTDGQYYQTGGGNTQASAQTSWLFQPTTNNLRMTLNITAGWHYNFGEHLSLTLSDVTDSTTLLVYSENGFAPFPASGIHATETFSLTSGDSYQLNITGNTGATAGDFNNQGVTASFAVVPEPATFGLISCGLIVFLTAKKRLRVKWSLFG
jgi:hypothetical protein